MKDKLTHSLPQIRCSEETRKAFDLICIQENRTLSNVLQIITEKIAEEYRQGNKVI
jgi:hypothetical protein